MSARCTGCDKRINPMYFTSHQITDRRGAVRVDRYPWCRKCFALKSGETVSDRVIYARERTR